MGSYPGPGFKQQVENETEPAAVAATELGPHQHQRLAGQNGRRAGGVTGGRTSLQHSGSRTKSQEAQSELMHNPVHAVVLSYTQLCSEKNFSSQSRNPRQVPCNTP